jgi:hypothetical protein
VRVLALAVAIALLASACGEEDDRARIRQSELTVTVWPEGRGGRASETWTLRCDPSGGTHPAPEAACRALAANTDALAPVPRDAACTEVYGGPQVARVTGVYRGRGVRSTFERTNGCEIERWDRLASLFGLDS